MDWIAEQYGFKVFTDLFSMTFFLFFIYIQFNLFVLICLSSIVNLTSTRNKNVFFWKKGSDYQLFSALHFLYQYTVVLSLSTYVWLVCDFISIYLKYLTLFQPPQGWIKHRELHKMSLDYTNNSI